MSVDRPFVDRPMVEVESADRAACLAADAWGLTVPELIRRGMNALYACDHVVLRVGHTTAAARLGHLLVDVMLSHRVPTVSPIAGLAGRFADVSVTAWERIPVMDSPVDWAAIGTAVRRVHDVGVGEVPAGYPVPSPADFPWWNFDSLFGEVSDLLDDPARRGLVSTIERHHGWQDAISIDSVVCHGDVHPGNVLMSTSGALLIDWDLLCTANAAWDHAMLTIYAERWGGDPAVYPAFAEGYGTNLADDPVTVAIAELRNVAATLMRVRAGRSNEAARVEAGRRLRYWRGDPRAPVWNAQ